MLEPREESAANPRADLKHGRERGKELICADASSLFVDGDWHARKGQAPQQPARKLAFSAGAHVAPHKGDIIARRSALLTGRHARRVERQQRRVESKGNKNGFNKMRAAVGKKSLKK